MINKKILVRIALIGGLGFALLSSYAGAKENGNAMSNESVGHGDEKAAVMGPALETHISNNGSVLVRGAKVTAVGTNSVTAVQTWGSYSLTWTVNVSSSTKSFEKEGNGTPLALISVGDIVSFSGKLNTTQSQGTVDAAIIRDFSKATVSFSGTVSSVDATSSAFGLTTNGGTNLTVSVSSSTSIMRGETALGLSSLIAGQSRVKVSGVLNASSSVLQASQVRLKGTDAMKKQGK